MVPGDQDLVGGGGLGLVDGPCDELAQFSAQGLFQVSLEVGSVSGEAVEDPQAVDHGGCALVQRYCPGGGWEVVGDETLGQ